MNLFFQFLRGIKRVSYIINKRRAAKNNNQTVQYQDNVQLFDQAANDYISRLISRGEPCMISKFGTIELSSISAVRLSRKKSYSFSDMKEFMKSRYPCLDYIPNSLLGSLCRNAGFFPQDKDLLPLFYEEYIKSVEQVSVLGSYLYLENLFSDELKNAVKVNLDGYYAPFYFSNPWTMHLKSKKVLVIHPFADDILSQYQNKRTKIWADPLMLPEFDLKVYKSVQSMLGIKTEYASWFDALEKMKADISKIDFDIALIGCGAYGMPLASYVKSLGRQAVHLAGWTQVLFGIIGQRWIDDPRVSKYINEYWIHPSPNNIPDKARQIENGCYW